jgi:hypothetical protein
MTPFAEFWWVIFAATYVVKDCIDTVCDCLA